MHSERANFFLPEDEHYLNCAYMAPMARSVEEAGIAGIRLKRVPARVIPDHFFETVDGVRERFSALVGAAAASVAIVPAVSYAMAAAAKNLPLESGQTVVLLHEQFPSNVYTWRRLAAERGAELRFIDPPEGPDRGRGWNERLLEAIDSRCAIVALPHVHWADGTLFDLEAVGRRARDVGAALIIDGTQSIGALPFDVNAVQPDLLVSAGYKWLLGPYSTGMAYVGPRLLGGIPLEESWIARKGSRDFAGLVRYEDDYEYGAGRFDVGERSNFILMPMMKAALDLVHAFGVARIQSYAETLMGATLERLAALGYRVEDPAWRAAHLFGIRTPAGLSSDRVKAELARRKVSVSYRGDAIRVAPHVYNDERDVTALEDALTAAVRRREPEII